MRRTAGRILRIFVGMALLCSLCACSSAEDAMQEALRFREQLLAAGGCSFHAAITADYGETVTEFELDCIYTQADGMKMTVTAPETLSGITASYKDDAAQILFDDVQLALEPLTDGGLAPMQVPWEIVDTWEHTYIAAAGKEDGRSRVTYQSGDAEEDFVIDTYLEDGEPIYAELLLSGQSVAQVTIEDFLLN